MTLISSGLPARLEYISSPHTQLQDTLPRPKSGISLQPSQRARTPYKVRSTQPLEKPVYQRIYSGRLGGKCSLKREDSIESLETHISLLSVSTNPRGPVFLQEPKVETKRFSETCPWVKLARKRHDALDTLRRTEATSGMGLIREEEYETEAEKLMDSLEKFLVRLTARTLGLACQNKSGSTSDMQTELEKVALKVKLSCSTDRDMVLRTWDNRPSSADGDRSRRHKNFKQASDWCGGSSLDDSVVGQSKTAPVTLTQLINLSQLIDNTFSEKVSKRIEKTLKSLDKLTLGMDTLARIEEVLRSFIPADYAVIPFMPQKIRIINELNGVIREDIKVRMGRPRYHEIRQQDLQFLDQDRPLNRASKNLMIFNWLSGLDEDSFEMRQIPDPSEGPPYSERYEGDIEHIASADEPDRKMFSGDKYDLHSKSTESKTQRAPSSRPKTSISRTPQRSRLLGRPTVRARTATRSSRSTYPV